MTVGSILSLGLGTFSDVNHVVTLGYGTSATPTPTPTPTGQVDTHDGGDKKVWYQRTYREPTRTELRSAIDRLPGEVIAELEALAVPQVQDSVYKPLELRINMEELAQREELVRRIVEAARLSDEEDEDLLLLI